MDSTPFPVIDLVATGSNIRRLRKERGLTVRDLQRYFGFEEPRAIYKWQRGETLPSVDNLYALGALLETPMEGILVPVGRHSVNGQQASACCSVFWRAAAAGAAGFRQGAFPGARVGLSCPVDSGRPARLENGGGKRPGTLKRAA